MEEKTEHNVMYLVNTVAASQLAPHVEQKFRKVNSSSLGDVQHWLR